jgi:hypothetical protein
MTDTKPRLWERQDWDTDASYARFTEFYLPLSPPRSMVDAYNKYKASRGQGKSKQVSGTWNRWFYGQDSSGDAIPGSKTWAERAAAYDDYILDKTTDTMTDELAKLRVEEVKRRVRDTDALLDLFHEMVERTPIFLTSTIGEPVQTKPDRIEGGVIVRELVVMKTIKLNIYGFRQLLGAHADLITQRAIALKMPPEFIELNDDKSLDDNISGELLSALSSLEAEGWNTLDIELPTMPEGLPDAIKQAARDAAIPTTFNSYTRAAGDEPDDIDDPIDNARLPNGTDG